MHASRPHLGERRHARRARQRHRPQLRAGRRPPDGARQRNRRRHRRPRDRPRQRVRRDRSPDRHARRRKRRGAQRPLGGDRRRVQRSRAEASSRAPATLPASSTRPSSRSSPARTRPRPSSPSAPRRSSMPLHRPTSAWPKAPNRLRPRVAIQVGEVERRLAYSAESMAQKINEQVSEAEAQLVSRANVISETFAAVGEHIGKSTNDAAKTIGVNTRELNAMLAARSAEITKILDETARPLVDRFTDSGGELQRSLEAATQQATERLRTENATLVNALANRTAETLAARRRRPHDAFGQRQRPDRPPFRVELAAQRAHRSGQAEPARRRRAAVGHDRQVRRDHREGGADLRHARRVSSTPTPTASPSCRRRRCARWRRSPTASTSTAGCSPMRRT